MPARPADENLPYGAALVFMISSSGATGAWILWPGCCPSESGLSAAGDVPWPHFTFVPQQPHLESGFRSVTWKS